MKKLLALLLAVLLLTGTFALGEEIDPYLIPDTMSSPNGFYEVAFVADLGQLKDKSFNEGTWNGVKSFAMANDLTYKYYQPANGDQATDEDRYNSIRAACDGGARVVVVAGNMQTTALTRAAAAYPEVMFIFQDGSVLDRENVASIAFYEEQAGYFAGYAVVMDGFTELGFCGGGGGTNAACCRFGHGYAQGANAAAAELGVQVHMKYSWQYATTFSPSPELQVMVKGWYEDGTQVVFSCGGSIFQSIVAAAAESDGYVIGADSDQSSQSDTVITSALKDVCTATRWALEKVYDGSFSEIANVITRLGAADDALGLPTAEESWRFDSFTVAQYEEVFERVRSGEILIDAYAPTGDSILDIEFSNLTIEYV